MIFIIFVVTNVTYFCVKNFLIYVTKKTYICNCKYLFIL